MDISAVHLWLGLSSLSHDLNVVNMVKYFLKSTYCSSWKTLHYITFELLVVRLNDLYFILIYSVPLAVDCGDPGTPTNGHHNFSSTTYTSVATYTCDVGYTLQGSNSRTCQSNGQWSGSVPQCNGMIVSKTSAMKLRLYTIYNASIIYIYISVTFVPWFIVVDL